ncbi:Laminin-like protein lam-2 [Echinococcus granulosus]|uniref:Laminin subunit gamma n=1 Tax=Echinococcus granulosus TaxID=6210 RepID=A0A068WHU0_ECHGR|nr:Laminin-like protein lam-2 [Echinococcus granulosus]CDS19288.1 Laminin subunit gamma [Echinococcus granulosus]
MTDRNQNNWWQSETMDENPNLHFEKPVTLTIDLGTKFYVNYVYLQFKSPRPHAMVIYKKVDDEAPWTPWAYFSSNCLTYFNMTYEPMPTFSRPDDVICREEYSTLQPLYDGEVVFSVINGRPGTDDFFHNPILQDWSTASQIKVELQKMHTFGDEANAESDTLLTYYFAIRKFTVGGRCMCNGHGNDCRPVGSYGPNPKLVCVCDPAHHTAGDNCERCAPGYVDAPWHQATPDNPHACKACECNGNSEHCEFDEAEYRTTGSGGICIGCGNNTVGKHCETCLPSHYPDPDRPSVCLPCGCDPMGTLEGGEDKCSTDGQCKCKPGVGGKRCDHCLPDHHSFTSSGCQPCNCNAGGSLNNQPQCDPYTGECNCKANVIGRKCDKCKPGTFGMMDNDPLGCKQCFCSGHSSECTLGREISGNVVPMEESELKALEEEKKAIFSCPNGTIPCSVCFKQDKKTLDIGCTQNYKGELECLCRERPNDCPFCPSGVWLDPQKDIRKEICQCPQGYTGPSCEQCVQGYRREPIGGTTTAICIPCTCNNNSEICDPETGKCECQHNTGGLFCDRCADGYYGNASAPSGTKDACKPCPCPHSAKCVETFLPLDKHVVVCVDCPNNMTGDRCERCAENFFGDPVNGIPCHPCDCSNNTDLRATGNCDPKTGVCQKCLFGTAGDHCEKCLLGYRRNVKKAEEGAPMEGSGETETTYARGCQPCYCDPRGTLAMPGVEGTLGICDEETGQCPCKPGVTGLRCDRCRDGFYGLESGKGCTECGCSPRGSKVESCEPYTGQCNCLPFTTGRTCDECLPGYFNLTTGVGCQDCGCHPYGSTHRQCNPNGQCSCRSFAIGKKCDQCEENRYDLSAGCLPCPPCYGLVQKHVHELQKKLSEVFGSGDGPDLDDSGDTSKLYEQMKKLNKTVQEAYNAVLQNSLVSSAITNAEHLEATAEELLKRASDLTRELEEYAMHKPSCMRPDLPQRLDSLKRNLGKLDERIKTVGQRELDSFAEKVGASVNRDSTLTEQVHNATETVKPLKEEASKLRKTVQDIDTILRFIEFDADKLGQSTHKAFERLNSELSRLKEVMAVQKGSLKGKIDHVQFLTLEQRQRLTKLFDTLKKVPDVSAEQSRLEEILEDWTASLNKSRDLKIMLETETSVIEDHIEKMRRGRDRLIAALARQTPVAEEKARIVERLKHLLNKSETAVQTARKAVRDAKQQLEDLTDFDAYVGRTKQELEAMSVIGTEISEDLEKIDRQIQGIHVQVDDALNAAQVLQTTVAFYDDKIKNLKDDVVKQIEETNALSKKQEEEDDLYSQVQYEFKSSSDVLDAVRPQAEVVVELGKRASNDVSQLSKDIDALLNKMKELKDKITKTSPNNGYEGDGAARFKEIKEEAENMKIAERIDHLRKINFSRVAELEYIRDYELKEFAANTKHLKRLLELLPMLNHQRCFYSGKHIEGSRRRKKRSTDNSTASGAAFGV